MSGDRSDKKPYFCIVGRGDIPIFESTFGQSPINGLQKETQFHQFQVHSCLDSLDQRLVQSNSLFLKNIEKYGEMNVSAYVTAGYAKLLLLHSSKTDESTLKSFFYAVHELYVKSLMNPFSEPHFYIASKSFQDRVTEAGNRILLK